jgi:hypothetical protein
LPALVLALALPCRVALAQPPAAPPPAAGAASRTPDLAADSTATPPPPDRSAPFDPARAAPRAARPRPGVPLGRNDLLRHEEQLAFEPQALRRALAHRFVQFGSEIVTAGDSVLVRNRDYGIDYGRGALFLLAPPAAPLALRVTYLYLPGPRQRSYRAAHIVSREAAFEGDVPALGDDVDLQPARDPRPARDLALPSTLQLSGSKTVGVSFGRNREASIDQSLRVEASGELAPDLRVDAVLSDDNLPVRPEGNTEELGDLSKVFIEIQGPVIGGVIGDYELERRDGEFVAMRRELRGGEARLRVAGQNLAVGAGLAKGELATATFRGVEGKQGPYDLLSARRLEFSTILPGSERVWFDGQLLRRGENQDYVVDYDRGELRFTSRRRVTADSEIGVDYQVSTERYRRDTRAARLEGRKGGLHVQGFFLDEGDDRDRPVGGDYTPGDVAALQAAGDRAAIAPGITSVGAGRGSYRFSAVDSTVVVYDDSLGDLEVSFHEVGAGRGSYDDDLDPLSGRRFFEFVGAGLGAFEIGRLLLPPSRLQLASGRLEAAPWRGARLAGEASVSGFDRNLFSAADDGDNRGEALDLRFDGGDLGLGRAGRAGLELHASQLSARFRSPGRGRPAFYYKEWNAEQDSLRGTERLAEATARWQVGSPEQPWLRFQGNAGRLDRGAALVTDRGQIEVGLGPDAQRGFDLRLQRLATDRPELGAGASRSRRFGRGGGRWRLGAFVPEVLIEADEFVRTAADSLARPSFRYLDVRYRLGVVARAGTSAAIEFGRRDTEALPGAGSAPDGSRPWQAERRNDTWGLVLAGRPAPSLATELALSRRTNQPRGPGGGAATRSDLGRALVSWSPRRRALRTEWRYEVSQEAVRTLQQVLVLAPDGRGDFDAEGRAVGRDQGLYDKVFRFSGESEDVAQIETSLRLELGGFGLRAAAGLDSSPGWLRRNVSLVQIVSVQEQTRSDRLRELYLLVPSAFQTDATVFGTFRVRQDWSLLEASKRHAVKLLLDWESELDGRFTGAPVRGRRGDATLRWDRSGAQAWSLGGEAGLGVHERQGRLDAAVPGRPSADATDERRARLLGRTGWRLSPNERLSLDLEYTRRHDALSGTRQQLVSLSPAAVAAPLRNLRLFASVELTHVREDKPADVLAPFSFEAPGTRTSASLTGSYRLGQNLNLNLTYNGLRHTDGRSTYDVKAETRAIF